MFLDDALVLAVYPRRAPAKGYSDGGQWMGQG